MTARTGDAEANEPAPAGRPVEAGSARPPSQGRRYVTALDGLRALCALGVIIIHTQSEKHVSIPTYIYTGALAGPLFLLFFAISGFVLYRAWARKHLAIGLTRTKKVEPKVGSADGGAEGGVFKFLLRRLLRIYPLYWVVATAALLVADSTTHHSLMDYVQVYLLLPFPDPNALLDLGLGIVVWTLLIDVVFYVYVAIHGLVVSAILKRTTWDPYRFEMATLLPMAVGFAMIHLWVPGPWAALSALPLGMAYAVIDAWQNQNRRRHPLVKGVIKWWWVPLVIMVPAYIVGTARVIAYKPDEYGDLLVNYLWIQIVLLGFGMFLLACIIWGPKHWGLNRFLASKEMVAAGLLTYGIYLWHPVVLSLLHQHADDLSFYAAVTVTLLGSAVLALITYRLVELPLSRQRKRLRDDGAPAPATRR
ncbi:MAG TPA: acyltransferase [Acidimicrobiales bacterium]|jgi:peptidoglycan/LPS O-acetylase OafA/YrhL|nr:acyltransferase [Acidimicrobiales bacterium]